MKVFFAVFTAVMWFAASPMAAQPRLGECMIGPSLGSTLLFPYFEVDLDDSAGVTTLLSIVNGLGSPTMTRLVVWSDWGVPTLAFDIYLDGFDVQPINVRNLFDGNIPSTGALADLSGFDFCDVLPPSHSNPRLTADQRGQLAADHTGEAGPIFGDCAGETYGDGIARGYVTVDVVDECSGVEAADPLIGILFTPADPIDFPYFADGGDPGGIAVISNRLWGDFVLVDFSKNSAQGSEAIALWADSDLFMDTDIFTFYGRYSGWDGRDDRVPLPHLWDQRFFNGGPFDGGADLLVYRDTGAIPEVAFCGDKPSWNPLLAVAASLNEDAGDLFGIGGDVFPVAAQRVDVSSLGIPYSFGWIQIDTLSMGSWVQPTLTAGTLFSAGYNGIAVGTLCDESPPVLIEGQQRTSAKAGLIDKRRATEGFGGSFRRLRAAGH